MPLDTIYLRAAVAPGASPINFQLMSAKAFRSLFEQTSDYQETQAFEGAEQWTLAGIFTCRDRSAEGNAVATRLALVTNGDAIAFIDLSPLACVRLARHLLEYSVASSNANGSPQVVAETLVALFEHFLAPATFREISRAIADATEELVLAKLALRDGRKTASL